MHIAIIAGSHRKDSQSSRVGEYIAKDLTRRQKRDILLSVECPKCGAGDGQWCTSPARKTTAVFHAARLGQASAEGRIQW